MGCESIESEERSVAFFFFQAEDGIRDLTVTGVQTCALPICELATQAQTVATHIGQLAHSVTQQLGQVTQQLQTGVTDTCTLASNAQQAVAARLAESTEMLGTIRQQLGEVQQAGRELSGAARTIELVLGGAQTRGSLGEVALERMLSDALPQAGYELQHRFATGEVVDAVLRFRDKL